MVTPKIIDINSNSVINSKFNLNLNVKLKGDRNKTHLIGHLVLLISKLTMVFLKFMVGYYTKQHLLRVKIITIVKCLDELIR